VAFRILGSLLEQHGMQSRNMAEITSMELAFMPTKKTVVLLGRLDTPTAILYNSLCAEALSPTRVIVEQSEPKLKFLERRVRRFGLIKVVGQVAFRTIVMPLLKLSSRRRTSEIVKRFALDPSPIPSKALLTVSSVNTTECISALRALEPDVIVVSGTRIISNKVLTSIPSVFINIHAGITPMYRGSHGGYWSLVQNDRASCGVTVHQVDAGVDTGPILGQSTISPARDDNFFTYGLLQQAAGLPLLKRAIAQVWEGRLVAVNPPQGASRLWTHPTIWEYLYYRLRFGIK
jgi:folate-dependent phosphoribosylglycinamide formyltransferase PurN